MTTLKPLPQEPDSGHMTVRFKNLKLKHVRPDDTLDGNIRVLAIRKSREYYHLTVKFGFTPYTSSLTLNKKQRVTVRRHLELPEEALKELYVPNDPE